jgi:hypothetical protein
MWLSLAGTWFGWYLCLSLGLERYLFPAVFAGSLFTATMLADVTDQFDFPRTMTRLRDDLRRRRLSRSSVSLGVLIGAWAITLPQIALTLTSNFLPVYGSPLAEVADFLNNHTPPAAVIESYDSEVLFMLNRPYHYPPDQTNVTVIARTLLKQDIPFNSDPLIANPDYLVVGSFIRSWQIYDTVIAGGQFESVYRNSRYEVYERVR